MDSASHKAETPTSQTTPTSDRIRDGIIRETIDDGTPDGRVVEYDLTILELLVRELEDSTTDAPELMPDDQARRDVENYHEGGTFYRATPRFLFTLSERLKEMFGYCTPTIACELWKRLSVYKVSVKKNTDDSPN